MEGSRRGRHRKDDNANGSVLDYAIFLALIFRADGNVSKAAMDLGHEGTKSFYDALARLRNNINGGTPKTDPQYDFLFAYDKKSQMPTWTEKGLELARVGEELLRTKKRYNDDEEKARLQNTHLTKCKTPLYPNSKILLTQPDSQSKFEIIYACSSCEMMMRIYLTKEFSKWRDEHPELFSTSPLAFMKLDITL
jgi:RNase P subunit RPR2